MDCECQKNKKSSWPSLDDETGEGVFHKEENNLFDRIINRRKYDYSSDEEDDLFLEELTKKVEPIKEETDTNDVQDSNQKDKFIDQLRNDNFKLEKDNTNNYDTAKEEQIRMKLYKLK